MDGGAEPTGHSHSPEASSGWEDRGSETPDCSTRDPLGPHTLAWFQPQKPGGCRTCPEPGQPSDGHTDTSTTSGPERTSSPHRHPLTRLSPQHPV